MPAPAIIDLTGPDAWYHGDTNTQTFRLLIGTTPVDLTGATGACWAENGGIGHAELQVTIGPNPGEVTIKPPTGVIGRNLDPGHWKYDLEITQAGAVTTWIQG